MIPKAALAPVIRYLIRARAGEARPIDVQKLYAAAGQDPDAVAWLDRRFGERSLPPGWRELETELDALAYEAAAVGVPLDRVSDDLLTNDDPLSSLRKLIQLGQRREPESTDPMTGREPRLDDLIDSSRRRIELFAVEEGFHFGLPPIEIVQLYEDLEADPRATQYLNLRFDEDREPNDWTRLRDEARVLAEAYDRLGYLPGSVLSEQFPRTGDRSIRSILDGLHDQLAGLGGAVLR